MKLAHPLGKSALFFAAIAAATSGATPASAQADNLDPDSVAAAVRYTLPLAFKGYVSRCSGTLDANGFALSNAPRLNAKFSEGVDAAWPSARNLIMQVAKEQAGDMSALFDVMEDDDLRPFVDGIVELLAAQEIKLEDCQTIERGLEILDPLPADNVGALFGFLVESGIASEVAGQVGNSLGTRQRPGGR